MARRRSLTAVRRPSRAARSARRGAIITFLCALALATLSGLMLETPAVSAASAQFYGVSGSHALLSATSTDTTTTLAATNTSTTAAATSTSTTAAATATDTPAAPTATDTPTATATATATVAPTPTQTSPYNLNVAQAASAAGWPQSNGNWCGIATVALIANYVNPGANMSQGAVFNALNATNGISQWGYPPQGPGYYGPGVYADISGDFGTDPRSIAYGLHWATGGNYHVVVDTASARDATYHIVYDLLTYHQPISVFVLHGQHSVIVSGVEATGNPISNPGSITYLDVWDPGGATNSGIQGSTYQQVRISDWLGTYSWDSSSYFKYPYAANVWNGVALDPDPSVGPYSYVPANYNHLWVGHWVYVSPMGTGAPGPDWAINQYGTLIAGYAGALPDGTAYTAIPAGYTGATVPMPTNPPPPPPPVRPPPPPLPHLAPPPPKPKPKPTPTPKPTVTPIPTYTPWPTLTPYVAPTATPHPVCDGVGCMLATIQANPGSLAIPLALLLTLAMLAATPVTLIWLRPRAAGNTSAAEVPLLPAPEGADVGQWAAADTATAQIEAPSSDETPAPGDEALLDSPVDASAEPGAAPATDGAGQGESAPDGEAPPGGEPAPDAPSGDAPSGDAPSGDAATED